MNVPGSGPESGAQGKWLFTSLPTAFALAFLLRQLLESGVVPVPPGKPHLQVWKLGAMGPLEHQAPGRCAEWVQSAPRVLASAHSHLPVRNAGPRRPQEQRGSRDAGDLISALRVLMLEEEVNFKVLCLVPNGCLSSLVRPGRCRQG